MTLADRLSVTKLTKQPTRVSSARNRTAHLRPVAIKVQAFQKDRSNGRFDRRGLRLIRRQYAKHVFSRLRQFFHVDLHQQPSQE